MAESPPALWPALLLMFAGAGAAGIGAWVASPHRPLPWSRRRDHRGRRRNRRSRERDREPRRGLAGAGRTQAERHEPQPRLPPVAAHAQSITPNHESPDRGDHRPPRSSRWPLRRPLR